MTCIAAVIMMQPDVEVAPDHAALRRLLAVAGRAGQRRGWDELCRGGVYMVLWVLGVYTARFLFFKTMFP